MAVTVQLPPEKGGIDGECVFIDTENTFRPERIEQIANGFELDIDEVLQKIHVARAFNSSHQILMAEKINELKKSYIETSVPNDLLSYSASGLDPHLSPQAIYFQFERVANARNLTQEQKVELDRVITNMIEKRIVYLQI